MTDVKLYGFPQSTYVRTARLACEEKGVAYEIVPTEIGSPENLAVHPFARVPAMSHGDFKCFETAAICRYVDEAFDGPALQPADARAKPHQSATPRDSGSCWLRRYQGAYPFGTGYRSSALRRQAILRVRSEKEKVRRENT